MELHDQTAAVSDSVAVIFAPVLTFPFSRTPCGVRFFCARPVVHIGAWPRNAASAAGVRHPSSPVCAMRGGRSLRDAAAAKRSCHQKLRSRRMQLSCLSCRGQTRGCDMLCGHRLGGFSAFASARKILGARAASGGLESPLQRLGGGHAGPAQQGPSPFARIRPDAAVGRCLAGSGARGGPRRAAPVKRGQSPRCRVGTSGRGRHAAPRNGACRAR